MFKIFILLTLSSFIATGFTYAQTGHFVGSIRDKKDGHPLAFTVVSVASVQKKYLVDSSGNFTIPDLVPGKYTISFNHTGYQRFTKEISIPGNASFYPEAIENQLDQVIVTAVAGATKIKRTPVSIAIVTQKEMNRNSSTNMVDALLKVIPGISAVTTGPNISKPFIRGLGYNRVLTMYDGVRQEGQQWGDEHGIEVDQYGILRAEVVKGPASLSYGSDAIAGVVNLIPFQPVIKDGALHGDAATEYQTNNQMAGGSLALYFRKNIFSWSIRASAKNATNYKNPVDGYVYNTGFKEWNLSAMAGWETTTAKNYLNFTVYDNLQEIPDGSRDSATRVFTYQTKENDKDDIRNRLLVPAERLNTYRLSPLHQHIQHLRVYHKGQYTIGGGELYTTIGLQQNTRREYNHPTMPQQAGLYVALQTLNYELRYSFPEWIGLRFTYGINGMYQQNKSKDATDFPIPDYRLFDAGTYIMAKKEFNKFVLSGGIRLDKRYVSWTDLYSRKDASGFNRRVAVPDTVGANANFHAFAQNFTGVSASIGAVYNFSNHITLKTNIARGYRSPNITESGSNGLDPGAHIYYIGNKNFVPEFNWQEDIGVFANYPDLDISLELFNNEISNYIFLQKQFDALGQPLEIVPGNFTYAYKQGSARLYGAEASLMLHPKAFPWIQLHNSIATITGLNTDQESIKILGNDAKYLPLIPPARTLSRLQFNLLSGKQKWNDAYVFTELETFATQDKFYAVDNTETLTKGYSLVNVGAGISINNKKDRSFCRLSININNLFDVAYQSHMNRLKYFEYYNTGNNPSGIYNMGRTLGMKAIFNW